jgi:glycosyltransferase involved in cell wall biosynthesis
VVGRDSPPSVCVVVQTTGLGGTEVHTLGFIDALIQKGYGIELVSCAPHLYDRLIEARDWRDRVRISHVALSVSTDDEVELQQWSVALAGLTSRVLILPKGEYRMGSIGFLRRCRRVFDRCYAIEHLEAEPLPKADIRRIFGIVPVGFGLWRRRLRWERQRAARAFDRIVAVSDAVKRRLVDDWGIPPGQIEVVRNGVRWRDLSRDSELGRQWRIRQGLSEDTFVFGMLTRLSHWKAIPVALQAAQVLMQSCGPRDFCLAIAGEGEQAEMLARMSHELGLASHVRFLGYTQERLAALSAFDAILFSSIREGLPLGLLEGMAAGCVPIVTRISGMPEAVDSPDIGWVVPPNDPAALAQAMREALTLEPAALDQMRHANVERVGKHFDLDESYRRILAVMAL